MKIMAWGVFLVFIAVSAAANFMHGDDKLAGALMAVVPVGFAAVITLLENMVARGKGSWPLYWAAGVVGVGAGVASYVGLATMALDHNVHPVVALLLPLAYDGVVAVASLAIRSLGDDHKEQAPPPPVNKPTAVTPPAVHTAPVPVVHTTQAAPVNTDQPVHEEVVHADVYAAQTPCTSAPKTPVNKPEKAVTPKPKKAVNKPTATPVNADRDQLRQRVHELRQTKTVRAVADELGISTGLVNKLSKEPMDGVHTEVVNTDEADKLLDGVDLDAELAEILGQNPHDEN